jgi:hypothetical protein
MRVIVTHLGEEIIKKLSEEDNLKKTKLEDEIKIHKIAELKTIARANEEKMSVTVNDAQKEIKVKQARNLPKVITEKYNNDSKPTSLLTQVNITKKRADNSLLGESEESAMNWTSRLNFQIRDIVNERSLSNLKDKIIKDKRMKEKLSRIDEKCFRTVYRDRTELDKLEEKLNKEISPDKINLIKYLNQKQTISEKFLDKVANNDEEQTYKLNRICQIVFHKQNDELIFNNTLKKALTVHKNREKVEYRTRIETLGRNIKDFNDLLSRYPKPETSREKYRDIHNDMVKTWRKFHADRLQRIHWKYHSQNTTTSDATANVSKIINASDIY